MTTRDLAGIVTAAACDDVNLILQYAFNMGPGNFGIPLSADGEAPATHFGTYGASTDLELATAIQALTDGTMPDVNWGEDGLPTEQDAIDACTNDNLTIDLRSGVTNEVAHFTAVATALGLQRVIEEV